MSARLLIVEDEAHIAHGLEFNFKQEGYDVAVAADGSTAMRLIEESSAPFDLIVLDLMLPEVSGYEICKQVRQVDSAVPILVLSARTLSEDKTQAFDCGADQYMTKPFALPELLSRVRNLLKRKSVGRIADDPPAQGTYRFGNCEVDFNRFQLRVDGVTHSLTTMELQLLQYFIEHEGRVLSRNQILEDVWRESADIGTRSIDNFVLRLRKLIEAEPSEPQHLLSIRGTGYRFLARPE